MPGATDRARGRGLRRCARRAGPAGVHGYSTGTAQAELDYARPGARLVFRADGLRPGIGIGVMSGVLVGDGLCGLSLIGWPRLLTDPLPSWRRVLLLGRRASPHTALLRHHGARHHTLSPRPVSALALPRVDEDGASP